MLNHELAARRENRQQEILWPDNSGEALVNVRERHEDKSFEASFALQLAGIAVDGGRESYENPSLLPMLEGMSAGQALHLVYARERNKQGQLNFKWHIRASTLGEDARTATDHARSFQKNLDLILAACAGGFYFTPVTSSDDQDEMEGAWQTHIEPRAVALSRVHTSSGGKTLSTVLAPLPISGKENRSDLLMSALLSSQASVQVLVTIAAFELSTDEQELVRTALKCVHKGVSNQRTPLGVFEKTHRVDPEQRAGLTQNLECWLKRPHGFRLTAKRKSRWACPRAG